MPTVPQFIPPRNFYPALKQSLGCLYCDFSASAASEMALIAAMDAHARYVNATLDRANDPHFEDGRFDTLASA